MVDREYFLNENNFILFFLENIFNWELIIWGFDNFFITVNEIQWDILDLYMNKYFSFE